MSEYLAYAIRSIYSKQNTVFCLNANISVYLHMFKYWSGGVYTKRNHKERLGLFGRTDRISFLRTVIDS